MEEQSASLGRLHHNPYVRYNVSGGLSSLLQRGGKKERGEEAAIAWRRRRRRRASLPWLGFLGTTVQCEEVQRRDRDQGIKKRRITEFSLRLHWRHSSKIIFVISCVLTN